MKILDGLKLRGRPAEIPDCGRDDLPQFFREVNFKVGAEIGVAKGEFTETMCKAGLKLYAVDPWKDYSDYHREDNQRRLDSEYENAKKRLAPYDCAIVRKTSMEAVKDFDDGSLDFVYIDGHHGFKYVTEDIFEWSKKVRKGGIISGHDYGITRTSVNSPFVLQVKYVVDAYTRAFKINNWYVLGRKNAEGGEKRDRWRSWMWIKA